MTKSGGRIGEWSAHRADGLARLLRRTRGEVSYMRPLVYAETEDLAAAFKNVNDAADAVQGDTLTGKADYLLLRDAVVLFGDAD